MADRWQGILARGGPVLTDGGTGSELRRRGMPLDSATWSGLASLSHYESLRAIHADYIAVGADVVTTNTFATNRFVLAAAGHDADFAAVNRRAVQAAREARDAGGREVAIAGSMSCLPPRFDARAYPSEAQERAAYRELAELLAESGVDLLALEMLQDTCHAAWACEAAAATGLPWWLGVSCRLGTDGGLVGYDVCDCVLTTALETLLAFAPSAVCVMHSPADAVPASLIAIADRWNGVIGAYPEWPADNNDLEDFAATLVSLREQGAEILGGCCGTTPSHIRAARAALSRR